VDKIDSEPDEIEGQVADQTDNEDSSEDSSSMPTFISKDGTVWYKQPKKRKKSLMRNIIRHELGMTNSIKNFESMLEVFSLFITDDIIDIIVNETNNKAISEYDKWNTENPEKQKNWKPTDGIEIKAYIGLLISQSAKEATKEPIEMLWHTDKCYCRPIFPATMSRDRFVALTRFIRFDDFQTRAERKAEDKLAPIRCVFDKFVQQLKIMMHPGTHMTVNEQLLSFRGRAPFRVYMKSKPDK